LLHSRALSPSHAPRSGAMTNAYKNHKEVELRSIVILVFGTLLFLVPIVGWILGPVCWIMGVVTLLSPVHGHRLLTWMFDNKKYGEIASQVRATLQQKYKFTHVSCPNCGKKFGSLTWNQETGGYFDCSGCQKRLWREADCLFFLPKPSEGLNNKLVKLFTQSPV
jgi:predicted RNA-binding Zn-ribbon protein involved in translation (DUF1610 family)